MPFIGDSWDGPSVIILPPSADRPLTPQPGDWMKKPEYAHMGPGYYTVKNGSFDGKISEIELGNFLIGKQIDRWPKNSLTPGMPTRELSKPEYAHLGPGYYFDGGIPEEPDEYEAVSSYSAGLGGSSSPRVGRMRPSTARSRLSAPSRLQGASSRASSPRRPMSARTTGSGYSGEKPPSFHMGGTQERFKIPIHQAASENTKNCPISYMDKDTLDKMGWDRGAFMAPPPGSPRLNRPASARPASRAVVSAPPKPPPKKRPETARQRRTAALSHFRRGKTKGGAAASYRKICNALKPQPPSGGPKWMGMLTDKVDDEEPERRAAFMAKLRQQREQRQAEAAHDRQRTGRGWGVGGHVQGKGGRTPPGKAVARTPRSRNTQKPPPVPRLDLSGGS